MQTLVPEFIDVPGAFNGHYHGRQGLKLRLTVEHVIERWCGATFMPNLEEPLTTVELAGGYSDFIGSYIPPEVQFTKVITCYLTDHTNPDELERGFLENVWRAAKLYMCRKDGTGGTTGSHKGVTDIRHIYPALARMEKIGMPLLIHGEVVDATTDEFDREKVFIDTILKQVIKDFPGLKIVLEHITTSDAVDFVKSSGNNLRATITIHHAMLSRNALFEGGVQAQYWCKPVLKREKHRLAVRKAMVSGDLHFGAGDDAALHWEEDKSNPCGAPAGIYTGHLGSAGYAHIFDEEGLLTSQNGVERLKYFLSGVIPQFYGLPPVGGVVRLIREEWKVPNLYSAPACLSAKTAVIPFLKGRTIRWKAKRVE